MKHGDIFGIGSTIAQFMGAGRSRSWREYAVPGIQGLYLAGPFQHPGGAVRSEAAPPR
jgi:phytoene dehydrogenase-like protein